MFSVTRKHLLWLSSSSSSSHHMRSVISNHFNQQYSKRNIHIVTAEMVKELRGISGAPMMDCKKALSAEVVKGDIKLALDWLRAKGIARASNISADRVTADGLIIANKNLKLGFITLVEVNSETDFVSLNKDFQRFVTIVSQTISEKLPYEGPISISSVLNQTLISSIKSNSYSNSINNDGNNITVQEALGDIISMIRENIVISRVENIYPAEVLKDSTISSSIASYVHGKVGLDNSFIPSHIEMGKLATVVKLVSTDTASNNDTLDQNDIGKKLAMHIVAANPSYLSIKDIPVEIIQKETDIFREQTKDVTKAPEMLEKIIAGKVNKRLSEICLLSQSHMAIDGSPIIQKYLQNLSMKVEIPSFYRWSLGQKKQM